MEEKETITIGAKALSDDQIKYTLPTYKLLYEQVEEIRNNAKNKDNLLREYNNVISIFGERGTGKTSIFYTVISHYKGINYKKESEQNSENEENINLGNDIVLDIIKPDNFGDNTKIMGSIIGYLSDEVDNMLDKIKENYKDDSEFKDYFNNCIYKDNNPLTEAVKEVQEKYCYTEKDYRDLMINHFDDKATYFKNASKILKPDDDFKKSLEKLVNLLIEEKKKFKKNTEPLIMIFIDDIDLKTTKCKELIEVLTQYINFSNVVAFVSGDYDILQESFALALLKSEKLNYNNMNPKFIINDQGDNVWYRKKYLTHEYLKKVIPPAMRHNLVKWDITTIPNFSLENYLFKDELSKLLNEDNLFEYKKYQINDYNIYLDIISNSLNYPYLIFDNKPRGIVNVISQLSRINNKDLKNITFYDKKLLIETIIESSSDFNNNNLLSKYIILGKDEESSILNYEAIIESCSKDNDTILFNSLISKNKKFKIELVLLSEFILILLPKIKYTKVYRSEFLYWFCRNICSQQVSLISNDFEESIVFVDRYQAMKEIIDMSSIKQCLIFRDILENELRKDNQLDYEYKFYLAIGKYYTEVNIEPESKINKILVEMNMKSKNIGSVFKTFNILNYYNMLSNKSMVYKDNYKKIIDKFYIIVKKLVKEQTLNNISSLYYTDTTISFKQNGIIELVNIIFYNYIDGYIHNYSADVNYDINKAKLTNNKLLLKKIKTKYKDNDKIRTYFKWIEIMNNINNDKSLQDDNEVELQVNNIVNEIFDKFSELFFYVINAYDTSIFIKKINSSDAYKNFIDNTNAKEHISSLYFRAIELIKQIKDVDSEFASFESMCSLYLIIKELSINTRVWYGYDEANSLINIIINNCTISLDYLKEEDRDYLIIYSEILKGYFYYKNKVDNNSNVINEFVRTGNLIYEVRMNSFKKAYKNTCESFSKIGIDDVPDYEEGIGDLKNE